MAGDFSSGFGVGWKRPTSPSDSNSEDEHQPNRYINDDNLLALPVSITYYASFPLQRLSYAVEREQR